MEEQRFQQAERAAMIGVVANVILAVIKIVIGNIAHSRALIADGVHSASDVIGSLAVFIGLRAARQPPDEDHPYGHGKAESIAAIIVSVILLLVGVEMGYSAFQSFFEPATIPRTLAIYAVILSIIIKEALYQYKYRLGQKLKSSALIANAHEHRSDVFSSLVALVGIGLSILGGANGSFLVYFDAIAGLIVSIFVIRMAWTIGAEAIHNTLDHVLHEEDTVDMKETVKKVPGVEEIHDFRAREHGYYVIVDVKIAVDPHLTVEEGHRIGKRVKHALMESYDRQIKNVFVHVNPYNEKE